MTGFLILGGHITCTLEDVGVLGDTWFVFVTNSLNLGAVVDLANSFSPPHAGVFSVLRSLTVIKESKAHGEPMTEGRAPLWWVLQVSLRIVGIASVVDLVELSLLADNFSIGVIMSKVFEWNKMSSFSVNQFTRSLLVLGHA